MTTWLDFSGAPAMLIAAKDASYWRGAIDPDTGAYADLDSDNPKTDYDRACVAAWPGRGVIPVADSSALVLYSEYDEHAWLEDASIVANGSWIPTVDQLSRVAWTSPFECRTDCTDYLLLNSAADGHELRDDDYLQVKLRKGVYLVEYANIEAEFIGCFTRLTFKGP